MAVEARHHLSLFPPPLLLRNREMMMNTIEANGNMYNTPPSTGGGRYGVVPPLSGSTTTAAENLIPMYDSAINNNFVNPAKAPDSSARCLTYTLPPPPPPPPPVSMRKRSRDFISTPLLSFPSTNQNQTHQTGGCGSFIFLRDDDISLQIRQQQLEIDCFIAQHTEKVRVEIENKRKQNCRRILGAMEEGVRKRVRVKEEEIEKIGKLNWALEEKVKSLCLENQIWRDLAQTNEATANALRSNLEQVLAQLQNEQHQGCGIVGETTAVAESCCDSNHGCGEEEEERRTLVENKEGERKVEKGDDHDIDDGSINDSRNNRRRSRWWCRKCGKAESCVVVLPCRHLCVCSVCESSLQTCPICKSSKNAILFVNQLSS